MTASLSLYCRLCAKQRLIHELIDLTLNFKFREEIVNKLSIFSSNLIDFSVKTLPETVCMHCIQLLNSTYEFFTKIKMSQLDLTHLTSSILKAVPKDSDHGQPDTMQPQHPPKHPKKCPNSKKESCVSKSKTEANDNIEFKISFDGYNVKRTHCRKQRNSEPAVSWSTYPWTCGHCNMQVQHLGILRRHSKGCHDVCFAMKCIDCTDDFFVDDFDSFVEHVREHRKELNDFCQHCNKKLEPDTIADHVKTHEKQLHCSYCGEFFADDFTLHHHLLHYQKRNANDVSWTDCQWKCKECSVKFTDQDSLRKHTKEVHQKCFAMQCADCPEAADSFNAYVEHAITHKPTLKFKCQLKNHMACHSDVKRYSCQYCEKTFRHTSVYKIHQRLHTGDRPYSCRVCGMEFANWSNCNKHMLRRHGATIAKGVLTPQGKAPINPKTGKPKKLDPELVKDWTDQLLRKRGRKK